jgi:hypothetical protein
MLLQGYQTLIREMATPTLPDYVTACLQLIKPPASGKPLRVPAAFVDTVACSLSKLVVLYPTTMRPSATQIKTSFKAYIAPTSSDSLVVPKNLRESSRKLFILLSYTAAKNGSSDEWVKAIRSSILDCHSTVDQVFRAVRESWESTTGYRSQSVHTGTDPSGGGEAVDELPSWTGVQAGAERVIGLLDFLAEYLNNPTKAPVTLPLGELLDLTARITLVTPPSSTSEDSIETNPAISRDEKAELWSVLPDIHNTVLRLHCALIRRLDVNAVPLATDILDQTVRVSNASRHIPSLRETAYTLTKALLPLSGPALPKLTVDSLTPLIQSSCHDILLATGHLDPNPVQPPQNGTTTTTNPKQPQQKPTSSNTTNADAYLTPSSSSSTFPPLTPTHLTATTDLLPLFLSHLPQQHLAPDLRGLVDRTAILSHNKAAMLASCLHPYRDSRGRFYPSILPFLVRQFPLDQGVEVLRGNLVRGGVGRAGHGLGHNGDDGGEWDLTAGLEDLLADRQLREEEDEVMGEGEKDREEGVKSDGAAKTAAAAAGGAWGVEMDVDAAPDVPAVPEAVNPFATVTEQTGAGAQEKGEEDPVRPIPPLKRKSEQFETAASSRPKRVDTKKAAAAQQPQVAVVEKEDESSDDSDSEGSVQIDMTLDDEEDEEEDEDDE